MIFRRPCTGQRNDMATAAWPTQSVIGAGFFSFRSRDASHRRLPCLTRTARTLSWSMPFRTEMSLALRRRI
jgi:hypothetical protein